MWKTATGNSQPASPIQSGSATGAMSAMPGGWHPTIVYLGLLLVAEVLAVGFLSRTLLK
jgi:hypothetical protein